MGGLAAFMVAIYAIFFGARAFDVKSIRLTRKRVLTGRVAQTLGLLTFLLGVGLFALTVARLPIFLNAP